MSVRERARSVGVAANELAQIEALFPASSYHWVADDLSNGVLMAWADRLQSFDLGAVIGGDPTAQDNGTTGRREVAFDGTGDEIHNNSFTMGQALTIGLVLDYPADNTTDCLVGQGTTATNSFFQRTTNAARLSFGASLTTGALTAGYTFLAAVLNGASSEIWVDGVLDTGPGDAGSVAWSAERLVLGARGDLTATATIEVGAMFMCPADISDNLASISNLYRTYYNNQWTAV